MRHRAECHNEAGRQVRDLLSKQLSETTAPCRSSSTQADLASNCALVVQLHSRRWERTFESKPSMSRLTLSADYFGVLVEGESKPFDPQSLKMADIALHVAGCRVGDQRLCDETRALLRNEYPDSAISTPLGTQRDPRVGPTMPALTLDEQRDLARDVDEALWALASSDKCQRPSTSHDCEGVYSYYFQVPRGHHAAEAERLLHDSASLRKQLHVQECQTMGKELLAAGQSLGQVGVRKSPCYQHCMALGTGDDTCYERCDLTGDGRRWSDRVKVLAAQMDAEKCTCNKGNCK